MNYQKILPILFALVLGKLAKKLKLRKKNFEVKLWDLRRSLQGHILEGHFKVRP